MSLGELSIIGAILGVALIAIACVILSRAVATYLRARGAPPHMVRGARVSILLIALFVAIVVLYVVFGVPPEVSGLTISAFVVLVVTLVFQTTFANVLAGLILIRNGVLRLNDKVQVGPVSGKVVQLGLVTTWVRMDDGSLASISNSTLLNGPLINRTASERLVGEF